MKIPRRIKELLVIVLFSYIIVTSVLEYVNTNDETYLIVPAILLLAILSEIASRYFGVDQKRGLKKKR